MTRPGQDDCFPISEPIWSCWAAAEFWHRRGCNEAADSGHFDGVTKLINGGLNGREDRLARYGRSLRAMTNAIAEAPAVDTVVEAVQPAAAQTLPEQIPIEPVTSPHIKQERPMLPPLVAGLASVVIDMFAPLAAEKVRSVLTRKGVPPAVVEQMQTTVIEGAKPVTGLADPVQAVARIQAQPTLVTQGQAVVLSELERMMPVLESAHKMAKDAWAAEEESRAAAAERMRGNPHAEMIDLYLTKSAVKGTLSMALGAAILLAALAFVKAPMELMLVVATFLVGIGTTLKDKLGTRYEHQYGSSRGSDAQKVIIGELARRKAE